MTRFFVFLFAVTLIAVAGCGRSADSNRLPVLDLAGNVAVPEMCDINFVDVVYVPLDSAGDEAFFKKARIIAVAGDTVVINADDERLVMFSAATGRYLGQISHKGQGPGEYRWLMHALVDGTRREALIFDIDRPEVYRYGLCDDSLRATHFHNEPPYFDHVTGSPSTVVNIGHETPDAFVLHQYDRDINLVDSIVMTGFHGGYVSHYEGTSNCQALFTVADTLCRVDRGRMEPLAVLSRGDRAMTFDIERGLMTELIGSSKPESEIFKDYILFSRIGVGGEYLYIVTRADNRQYHDIYRLADSRLVYRDVSDDGTVAVTWGGNEMRVADLFAVGNRWYGIVGEDEAVNADGTPVGADSNCGLISFAIQQK